MDIDKFNWQNESQFRGHYKVPRSLTLDLFNKKITIDQFSLLILFISIARWDDRDRRFGICKKSNTELSEIIGLNPRKVKNTKLLLQAKKYINLIKGKNNQTYVKIMNPYKYFSSMRKKQKKPR